MADNTLWPIIDTVPYIATSHLLWCDVFDEGHIALNSKSENHPYNRTPDYSCYTVESRYSGTTGTQLAVLYGEAPLIQRYVDLYTALRGWGIKQCPH